MIDTNRTLSESLISDKFVVTDADVEKFRRQGYLPLRGLLGSKAITGLTDLCTRTISAPSDNYGAGFSRLKYDIGNDHPFVLELISDPNFASMMRKLTRDKLFFTQGLGFELESGKSTGFPWHVGTQSFGFQRESDLGYTVWIPLTPIDPKAQRGGMAYIGKDKISGRFVYQHIKLVTEYAKSKVAAGEDYSFTDFNSNKNSILNYGPIADVLESAASEDSFALGDALIFDKYVLHRSVPLMSGPVVTRLAYALRFSTTTSRYDLERVQSLGYPRSKFNYDVGSNFNEQVCSRDGELVYNSRYFDATRAQRTI